MAIPTQGGLNQASAAQAKPPVQAGGKFDVDAVQAENVESQSKPAGSKDKIFEDLGSQREAMNTALLRMRQSLDERKNRMFDPVLMQTAAGFLKPTKSGSFGESLGYAAENAGVAAEREMLHDRENQKLEMELLGKEQELRQQLGGDQLIQAMMGGKRNVAPPAGGAITAPSGQSVVPGTASPVGGAAAPNNQQVLNDAQQGRILVTEDILLLAQRVAPKLLPTLIEIRKSQTEDEKNRIERVKLGQDKRKVIPRGGRTEREMNVKEYADYQAALNQYLSDGDEQKLLNFYDSKGYLESEQARGRTIPPKPADGTAPANVAAPSPIGRAKTQQELDAEKEQMVETQKIRAAASEARGNQLMARGENAPFMESLANDVLSLTDSNTRAFQLMQNASVRDSVLRAIEQGASASAGPISVSFNLPVRIAIQGNKEYQLTNKDIEALQLFQQKQSAITAEMRKMSRSPGEGATDKAEGQLYAAIGLLPTDSAKVLALKSEAMIQRARYDSRARDLWAQFQEDSPNKSFTSFQNNNAEFKELQKNYVSALNDMREKNSATLRSSPQKTSASAAPSSSTSAPTIESPIQRFQREKIEREKKARRVQ